jgi:hypothetical protein
LSQKTLLGLDVAQYNPERDPDGSGARKLVDLLVSALSVRLETPLSERPAAAEPVPAAESTGASTTAETSSEESASAEPAAADSTNENSN